MFAPDNVLSKIIALAGFILLDLRTADRQIPYAEYMVVPGTLAVLASFAIAENSTRAQRCVNVFIIVALVAVLTFPLGITHPFALAVPAAVMIMIAVDDPGPLNPDDPGPLNPDDYIALYDSGDDPEGTEIDTDDEPEEIFGNVV